MTSDCRYLPKNDTAEDGCMAFQSPCDAILENNIDLTGVRCGSAEADRVMLTE